MTIYNDGEYFIGNGLNGEFFEFVKYFPIFNEKSGLIFFNNKEEIFRVSSNSLGMESGELNLLGVDFYRAVGIDIVSDHLVQNCIGSENFTKRDLVSILLYE